MKFIYRYVKPYMRLVIVGFCIKFLGTVSELFLPSLLAYMIDDIAPTGDVSKILAFGVLMIFFAVCALFFNVVANRTAARVARGSCEKIRHDLFEKIQQLSCAKTDEITIPSLEARLTSDTYNLHNFIGRVQRIGVRAPILLIGGIIVTVFLDVYLALVLIATLPLISGVVFFVSSKGVVLYKKLQEAVDGLVRVVRENALGVRVIKALSKGDYEISRFAKVNDEVSRMDKRASLVMGLSNPIISLILNTGLCGVLFVGAYRVNRGLCDAGKIIAFMTYFTMMSNAMLAITRVFMMTSKGVAGANRISEIVDTKDGIDKLYCKVKEEYSLKGIDENTAIAFDGVDFSYIKGKKRLSGVDFSVKRGGMLGVIGSTGSGKSTLVSLLLRFYEPDCGGIYIDGKDIRSYEKDELRSKFGVVLQSDFIFEGTIRQNICFGRTLSDEQIEKALKTAQAWDFVNALADKTDHMLSAKGTNLSGGQRQRLLIARALASNPEILVLDDSSSALDYKTDASLRLAIRKEYAENTTLVCIAQRVSSVKDADLILVLEKGRVLGKGTHEELLESCEAYREIAESQMGVAQ